MFVCRAGFWLNMTLALVVCVLVGLTLADSMWLIPTFGVLGVIVQLLLDMIAAYYS